MTTEEVNKLEPGLYRFFLKGSDIPMYGVVGALGFFSHGKWFALSNWEDAGGVTNWSGVDRVEKIDPDPFKELKEAEKEQPTEEKRKLFEEAAIPFADTIFGNKSSEYAYPGDKPFSQKQSAPLPGLQGAMIDKKIQKAVDDLKEFVEKNYEKKNSMLDLQMGAGANIHGGASGKTPDHLMNAGNTSAVSWEGSPETHPDYYNRTAPASSYTTVPTVTRKKFEYKHMTSPDLNVEGQDGWELCSVLYGPTGGKAYYFKREITQ